MKAKCTPDRPGAFELWNRFVVMVETTVYETNRATQEDTWEVMAEDPRHLCVQSVANPSLAADIEFFPGLLRVVCVFKPAGRIRVYQFESGGAFSQLEPGVVQVRPEGLANALPELISCSGRA